MALDLSKLQNVLKLANGDIQTRCPACAGAGADTKGEHLKIYSNGAYSCAANQGDKEHTRQIHKLAGIPFRMTAGVGRLTVNAYAPSPSEVLIDLANVSRFARKRKPADETVDLTAAP